MDAPVTPGYAASPTGADFLVGKDGLGHALVGRGGPGLAVVVTQRPA